MTYTHDRQPRNRRRRLLALALGCLCSPAATVTAQDRQGLNVPSRNPLSEVTQGIGSGSGMAESVMSALRGLTQLAMNTATKLAREEGTAAKLSAELARLVEDKSRLMGEYRSGMFCSGCGQTRSQILAKGETFPHSGQVIVRPTPEQIARKEAELDAEVDRKRKAWAGADEEVQRTRGFKSRLELQLTEGNRLWNTALSLANGLRLQAGLATQAMFAPELSEISKAIEAAENQLRRATEPAAQKVAQEEVELLKRVRAALLNRLAELDRQLALAEEKFGLLRRSHEGSWQTWIPQLTSRQFSCMCSVSFSPNASDTPATALGLNFLMGSVPTADGAAFITPIGSVSGFLAEFRVANVIGANYLSNPELVSRARQESLESRTPTIEPAKRRLLQELPR